MVHPVQSDIHPAISIKHQGLFEDKRFSVVSTSYRLFLDMRGIWTTRMPRYFAPAMSIVICTYGRPESLDATLESLQAQSFNNFEVILITEKGDLSNLRDKGLRMATGAYTAFIDDDVYCPPTWAQSVFDCFRERKVVGVTGPTEITEEYINNRDILKYKRFKRLYDKQFLDNLSVRPSYLSQVGAPSTASNNPGVTYEGEAGYLEACNFTVRTKEARWVGGFSSEFTGTSEWCEVDIALRLKAFGTLCSRKSANSTTGHQKQVSTSTVSKQGIGGVTSLRFNANGLSRA